MVPSSVNTYRLYFPLQYLDACCSIPTLINNELLNECFYRERGWGVTESISTTTPATRQGGENAQPEGGADEKSVTDGGNVENMPMRMPEVEGEEGQLSFVEKVEIVDGHESSEEDETERPEEVRQPRGRQSHAAHRGWCAGK
jgi:hypothetical protein